MIPVSTDYRQQLIAGNRNWVIQIPVFLSGNAGSTPDFTLTNENIWDNGIVLDEAISSDNSFDIGAAIVGSLKVVIDNITGNFSQYDFYGAKLTLWLGVEGDEDNGEQRYYRMGFFVVDTPSYNGSLITLNCLDNMTWFDVPFDSVTGITYPANAGTVVQKICQTVGVTLGTPTFPNYANTHTRILAKPEQQLNCREVLQYIAQMCCCYCKINTAGQLVLKWHDKSAIIGLHDYDGGTFSTHTTPYSDGDAVDGMLFNPWNQGTQFDGGTFEQLRDRAYISQNYDCEVSTDDVVITGCRVRNNTTKDENKAYDELWVDPSVEATHPRYVLIIENNPFITKAKAANIANIVGNTLAGLPTRGFTATSLADFSYETGDMATVVDFRGNRYYTWITHFTFTTNNSEKFSCGVESIKKRSEQRFSGTVKTLAEANQNAEDALTAYDNAVKAMDALAQNAIGYNEYVQTVSGAKIMYRYNGSSHTTSVPPKFQGSTVVFKISGDGVFVALAANGDIAADGTCTFSNGYDANSGTAILNLIYAQGLNAGWITAGSIDANRIQANVITAINNNTGSTVIDGGRISITGVVNGINSGSTTINGGKISTNTITADQIAAGAVNTSELAANAVTADKINAGAVTAGKIDVTNLAAISANMGTVNVGGNGNGNGVLNVNDASGSTKVTLDSLGIRATYGNIGGWSIDQDGLTYGDDARVRPNRIACGQHGATLIGMSGKSEQGDHDGYFEVGVNESSDYIHVHWNYISKNDSDGTTYAVFEDGSDERLKKDIEALSLEEALMIIKNTEALSFRYKENDSVKHYGFTAQRLEAECEELGLENPFVRSGEMRGDLKNVSYTQFIAPLVKVVQNQQEEIDLLKQEVAELKARIK